MKTLFHIKNLNSEALHSAQKALEYTKKYCNERYNLIEYLTALTSILQRENELLNEMRVGSHGFQNISGECNES
jgi:hypothetical protein